MKDFKILREAFLAVASAETSCYPERYNSKKSKLDGHCSAVATTIQGMFGGDILTGKINGEPHYWNRLPNGDEIDLTSCQFGGDGFSPLKKGRKVNRPQIISLVFLTFAARVSLYLGTKNSEN